jgi:hypothetical protein
VAHRGKPSRPHLIVTVTVPKELLWLQRELARAVEDGKTVVVMSHHAPTRQNVCDPKFGDTPFTDAFATSLEDWIRFPITAWLFGHTHWSSQQVYNVADNKLKGLDIGEAPTRGRKLRRKIKAGKEVLVASNQLGYIHHREYERSRYNPFMTLAAGAGGVSLGPSNAHNGL